MPRTVTVGSKEWRVDRDGQINFNPSTRLVRFFEEKNGTEITILPAMTETIIISGKVNFS